MKSRREINLLRGAFDMKLKEFLGERAGAPWRSLWR